MSWSKVLHFTNPEFYQEGKSRADVITKGGWRYHLIAFATKILPVLPEIFCWTIHLPGSTHEFHLWTEIYRSYSKTGRSRNPFCRMNLAKVPTEALSWMENLLGHTSKFQFEPDHIPSVAKPVLSHDPVKCYTSFNRKLAPLTELPYLFIPLQYNMIMS